ncbi:hypothetical protein PVAG01_00749 [Phlyctema vagabunda]|uniref:PHD-type domain-containing protein n=1 Tax=Phlyctema vagabunda TaxID=108571 RepID=A0ABR4PV52_9HELO
MAQIQLAGKKRKTPESVLNDKTRDDSADTLDNVSPPSILPNAAASIPEVAAPIPMGSRTRRNRTTFDSLSPKASNALPLETKSNFAGSCSPCKKCLEYEYDNSGDDDFISCFQCHMWYHKKCLTEGPRKRFKHELAIMGPVRSKDLLICHDCARNSDKYTRDIREAITVFYATIKEIKRHKKASKVQVQQEDYDQVLASGSLEGSLQPQSMVSDTKYSELKHENELLKMRLKDLETFKPANEDRFQTLQEITILDHIGFLKQLISDYVQTVERNLLHQGEGFFQQLQSLQNKAFDSSHIMRDILGIKKSAAFSVDHRLEKLNSEILYISLMWWFIFDIIASFQKKDLPEVKLLGSFSTAVKKFSYQRWPTKQSMIWEEILLRAWETKFFGSAFEAAEKSLTDSFNPIMGSILEPAALSGPKRKEILGKIVNKTVSLSTYLSASRYAPRPIKPMLDEAFDPEKHEASDRDFMDQSKEQQRKGKIIWIIRPGIEISDSTSGHCLTLKAQVIVA